MNKRLLVAIGVLLCIIGSCIFSYPNIRLFLSSADACSNIPLNQTTKEITGKIEFLSPVSDITGIYVLPIEVKIDNFDLHNRGNQVLVWVDGKAIPIRSDIHLIHLLPTDLRDANISLEDGSHNICLGLWNGINRQEVAARVGRQFYWRWRGPDQLDFKWLGQLCLPIALIASGILVALVSTLGTKTSQE